LSIRHAESVAQELELLSKYTRTFLKQFTSMRDYELVQLINKATTIYNVLRDYERYVKRVMRF